MKRDTPKPAPDKGAEKKTDGALDDRDLEKVTGAGVEHENEVGSGRFRQWRVPGDAVQSEN